MLIFIQTHGQKLALKRSWPAIVSQKGQKYTCTQQYNRVHKIYLVNDNKDLSQRIARVGRVVKVGSVKVL